MNLKSFGEHADGHWLARRNSADLEQYEVLLRCHAGRSGGQLTHAQEPAHLIAELGKRLVIDRSGKGSRARGAATHHSVSISRHDIWPSAPPGHNRGEHAM